MYGLFIYIYHKDSPNVGKCNMHWASGIQCSVKISTYLMCCVSWNEKISWIAFHRRTSEAVKLVTLETNSHHPVKNSGWKSRKFMDISSSNHWFSRREFFLAFRESIAWNSYHDTIKLQASGSFPISSSRLLWSIYLFLGISLVRPKYHAPPPNVPASKKRVW